MGVKVSAITAELGRNKDGHSPMGLSEFDASSGLLIIPFQVDRSTVPTIRELLGIKRKEPAFVSPSFLYAKRFLPPCIDSPMSGFGIYRRCSSHRH